jgi:hypothetical protein
MRFLAVTLSGLYQLGVATLGVPTPGISENEANGLKTKLANLQIPPEFIRLCLIAIGADDGIVAQSRPLDKTLTHNMINSVDTYEYWSNKKFDECFNVLRRIRWIQGMRAESNWMMNENWEKSKPLGAEEAERNAAVLHLVLEGEIRKYMIEKFGLSEDEADNLMSIA